MSCVAHSLHLVLAGVLVKRRPKHNARRKFALRESVSVRMIIKRECRYFSVTTDIWTSMNTDSYLSLTLHYVTPDFRFRNWTLEVKAFPGRHSGEAISAGLLKLFDRGDSTGNTVQSFFAMEHRTQYLPAICSTSTTCLAWRTPST
eukprot:jgi/Phyca11/131900/e_gw1.119.38.1